MSRCIVVFLLIFLSGLSAFTQRATMPFPALLTDPNSLSNPCATDIFLNANRKNPAFKKAEDRMNAQILAYSRRADDTNIITLPVVFHIVDDNPDLFSDAQVAGAIADLNDAFSKSGSYAASVGADTKIRFCLSKKDPDGGITTGITRTVSFFSNDLNPTIEDTKLKNLVQWDPSRYINIWYIKSMHMEIFARFQCGAWLRMYAGGYATLPPGGGPTDGIVITAVGDMLAHEMGHYLGLYHTFEGMDCRNFNCMTDGDKVCDTPPDASVKNSASCSSPENSCSTDTLSGFTIDVPDRIANFMDYGNGGCHNEFTQGQTDRMRAAIATQRSGLLQDECTPPCTDAILASFTRDNPYPLTGANINFTNTSTGATNYQWIVDGTVVSTAADYATSFAAPGKYKVTLKADNGGSCFSTFTHYIIVTCGVTARFYTDKRNIASIAPLYLDSIRFTNTSINAASYQWLMSNDKGMTEQVISTAQNLTYVFAVPANYTVRLIAANGSCIDTSGIFTIPVTDPTPDGTLYINSVECYQQTKVRVSYYICNSGYGRIPKKIPVTFYNADPRVAGAVKLATVYLADSIQGLCCGYLYTTIINVGYKGLNTLYGSFNDSGNVVPVVFPATNFIEKNYFNNVAIYSGFAFKVTAAPPLSILEWGDTLQLSAVAHPGTVSSYIWSTPKDLSCTNCRTPLLIADSSTIKQVVATSNYGCTDTGSVVIQVPPYNDFSVDINDVQCKAGDSLLVNFTIRNSFKRAVIPKRLTVAFYKNDPLTASGILLPQLFTVPDTVKAANATYTTVIKGMGSGKLYAAVGDSGKVVPVVFPATPFLEKSYANNISSFNYQRFFITPSPAIAVLAWRDTLPLTVVGTPAAVASYLWSTAYNLSCASCQSPNLVADTTAIKTVIATSALGCADTASVTVQVPPYNDFTVSFDEVQCSKGDSLHIIFTIKNSFKRPLLPKGLAVAFYNADPRVNASLLGPVFSLPDTLFATQATFSTFIKGMSAGTLYAAINDSAKRLPVVFPATSLLEKEYQNNVTAYSYAPELLKVQPADTTVFRKQSVPLLLQTTVYNPPSTLWNSGGPNPLSCATCTNPVLTVYQNSIVKVQTENKYGCLLKGTANIKIFPPDMQVKILETKCYTNNTALVTFSICMNNGYDSVFSNIPVSFYDGDPAAGPARILLPVFKTPSVAGDSCYMYTTKITAPSTKKIAAVVNDKGDNTASIPSLQFAETNASNNVDVTAYTPFTITIYPADTLIDRLTGIQLNTQAFGGTATSYLWSPVQYLSCTYCPAPFALLPYTMSYQVLARNEFNCTDTATAIVRTHTQEGVYIPTAFTPNGDGKNDIFFISAGSEVTNLKTFSVYNRWGQQIFSVQNAPANSPAYGWNGRVGGADAPSQVYVYYVTVILKDGKEKSYKGNVTLIR